MMMILIIGAAVGIWLFMHFQLKTSRRNETHFERSRQKYERMLERLAKLKEQDVDDSNKGENK
jgi:hypothetical protein